MLVKPDGTLHNRIAMAGPQLSELVVVAYPLLSLILENCCIAMVSYYALFQSWQSTSSPHTRMKIYGGCEPISETLLGHANLRFLFSPLSGDAERNPAASG